MQVEPSDAWLQGECDGTAYFPQVGGSFNLHNFGLGSYAVFIVEGLDISATVPALRTSNLPPPRPPSSVTVTSTPHPSTLPPPVFRSVTAPSYRRGATFSLKVVKATMLRKGRG